MYRDREIERRGGTAAQRKIQHVTAPTCSKSARELFGWIGSTTRRMFANCGRALKCIVLPSTGWSMV